MVGDIVRQVSPISMSPLQHFFCYDLSSLSRSKSVWNIMAVDKVLCKSKFGGFGISIACREVKSIPRVSIPLRTQYGGGVKMAEE